MTTKKETELLRRGTEVVVAGRKRRVVCPAVHSQRGWSMVVYFVAATGETFIARTRSWQNEHGSPARQKHGELPKLGSRWFIAASALVLSVVANAVCPQTGAYYVVYHVNKTCEHIAMPLEEWLAGSPRSSN